MRTRPAKPRLQRTSSASPPSPLSRRPLGVIAKAHRSMPKGNHNGSRTPR
jgi:hypothetical protein